jgi:hypothetical protein
MRALFSILVVTVASTACGGASPVSQLAEFSEAGNDAPIPGLSASGGDAASPLDPSSQDASLQDAAPEAASRVCASGQTMACSSLAGSWSSGTASCRGSGSGWDVSGCTLASPGKGEEVKPAQREPSRFAAARCNDGTPFDFKVRLAPRPSSVWVIWLEGGFYCDDYSSPCSTRPANLKSTNPGNDEQLIAFDSQGIFNTSPTVNPDFYDTNMVSAHYCSSDFWAGATSTRRPSTGDPTNGWYFSGHPNVDALIAMLAQRYGLDDSNPSLRVLLGGSSAGAFGAHFNQARVVAALPNTAAGGRLALFVDAGWMTDWDNPSYRMGSATTPDADVWKKARTFYSATFDPDCEKGATSQGSDPSTCFMAPAWYPYVAKRSAVLIQQCSFDQSFTSAHHLASTDAPATTWETQVKASFVGVTWLFSGSMPPYHTLAISDAGFATGPTGNTLADVVHAFWTGAAPERVQF